MTDPDLNQLFLGFRERGDLNRFGELFDALAPDLMATAQRLTGDAGVAEDLVQSTFLIAMEHADRFDPRRPVDGWFGGILSRQARDWNRHDARRPDPERGGDATDWLRMTVRRQPRVYRDVLLPHVLEGLEPPAIADRLGLSVATVRVRLNRGLRRLRAALPAGFVAGTAFAPSIPRGLDAVRRELIEHARGPVPAATSPLGPLPATVPTALAFVAVLAVGGWALWGGGPEMREVFEPIALDDLTPAALVDFHAAPRAVVADPSACRFLVRISLRPDYAARTGRHPGELTAQVASWSLTPDADGTLEFTAVAPDTLDLIVSDGAEERSIYRLEARPGGASEVELIYPGGI